MKVVYEAANLIDAHLVRHALEAVEIPVYLRGEQLLGGMGELPLFGVIAVCVPEVVWPQAREIVQSLALGEEVRAVDESDDDLGWLPA
ncbi:putative signal transducing protein [Lysobacter terrae]